MKRSEVDFKNLLLIYCFLIALALFFVVNNLSLSFENERIEITSREFKSNDLLSENDFEENSSNNESLMKYQGKIKVRTFNQDQEISQDLLERKVLEIGGDMMTLSKEYREITISRDFIGLFGNNEKEIRKISFVKVYDVYKRVDPEEDEDL